MKIKLKMDTRTLQDVAMELEAHERECSVYRDMTKMQLEKLEGRIKRLEMLIMASTISTASLILVIVMKTI
jgi:transposase